VSSAPFLSGTEHLLAELERVQLLLHRHILRLRDARQLTEHRLRGLCIPDQLVDALLAAEFALPDAADFETGQELTRAIAAHTADIERRVALAERAGVELPLTRLTQRLGLGQFERDVLLIALAPEVDLKFQTLFAYAQNDVTRTLPSIDLVLKLLCSTPDQRLARRSVFAANGPLLSYRLVTLVADGSDAVPDPPFGARLLSCDSHVTELLLGADQLRPDVRACCYWQDDLPSTTDLVLPADLVADLDRLSRSPLRGRDLFLFEGPYGSGRLSSAGALCRAWGRRLLVLDTGRWLATPMPPAESAPLIRMELALQNAAIYIRDGDLLFDSASPASTAALAALGSLAPPGCPVLIGTQQRRKLSITEWHATRNVNLTFPVPDHAARLHLWRTALRKADCPLAADVDPAALATRFVVTGGQIRDAMAETTELVGVLRDEPRITLADLFAAVRHQSNSGLRRLAQKLEPVNDWSDLVLPAHCMEVLQEVASAVRNRHVVYGEWGFGRRRALGKGLDVLFSGPSGTGKTLAASILAGDLGLDLYRIDLAAIVSKYIGETEQNLSRVFAEAESSNAILFFDEADALLGKRSEVKDAHDRYANIEVAYLLQKMEEYSGVVILATNLSRNMDEAFARRMHYAVDFPFPDVESRERIWRQLLPPEAPLADDINLAFLARQFELAGGHIRNVTLLAAFLAAQSGGPLRMEHLVVATARELHKLGQVASQSEFREYYDLIRDRQQAARRSGTRA
jgi:SpoVK/Ycf46/Vps4 family AAA+-type ATPase